MHDVTRTCIFPIKDLQQYWFPIIRVLIFLVTMCIDTPSNYMCIDIPSNYTCIDIPSNYTCIDIPSCMKVILCFNGHFQSSVCMK